MQLTASTRRKIYLFGNKPLWVFTCAGVSVRCSIGYESSDLLVSDRFPAFKLFRVWLVDEKSNLPASFCCCRYAPPLHCPVRHAGNGNKRLVSAGFIIPGAVRKNHQLGL
ncbi:hypothetical protein ILYODFUR_036252 [Ilyodon furcidens]|uniref:Uncharacterized protein n=1 Tax=Ilyodon furcidens TaxID=33524 RepID=A0ABV0VLI7_9TELE